ncbi:MAG: aspartate-semialdehyde dehydrogenase [Peptostreptococcus sp.]|uniref:Aspartate-semialdehyde dehydrogenase n=1 Tax=Peptostreptococcus anaerobius TaxID=1261 RepID=A0A379CJM6_9FIRM|nr:MULTISPECIES: aspartate-semialdehyde dehydrogenase [Peptostreptococcus]EKX95098.1 aspartate-semialdehyde dehydrogenase [Peptostreptococcus anaerobius VPI 4330 = DSM 2949]MDU3422560.1 aspartate-semialdehyde dehydrogenase [Peptostreptococcus anaerobius]MDU3429443.1 aspartate-semialdehyde dehydrogenase [Peptostreptococcus sp.]MDU5680701.1 aspartate-semialdehyde dehydrogenase [Peptostreptococcus sp.]MDU5737664.1 aspartate-semialdehyde dehydrogenase [Peptostreptococcus sp.]
MANFAIVGATGVVGTKMIERLAESNLEVDNIYMMASAKSAGKKLNFRGREITVEELNDSSFDKDIDYALFSAGGDTSLRYAPIAEAHGVIVIDNSSAWRMDPEIDLVVPECNRPSLKRRIIANPNCSTIQSVVPLKPLNDAYGIKRIAYTTYQAVSGSGLGGIKDLENGQKGIAPEKYPHPIYNNVLPHIDVFLDNGYTKEEMKMILETKKILELGDDVSITATCARVPVFNSHSVEINVSLKKDASIEDIRDLLRKAPGLVLMDDPQNNVYPMAIDATGHDEVYVGRIRRDISQENSYHIWCVADNIRKGAASNAVQIAELLEASK